MELMPAVLGVLKAAVTKVADCTFGQLLNRKNSRDRIDAIKFQLKTNRQVETFFPLLGQLREIFLENRSLLQDPENITFFTTWLRHSLLESPVPCSMGGEFWTLQKIRQLRSDVEKLKV
jgi:hypothetical protein